MPGAPGAGAWVPAAPGAGARVSTGVLVPQKVAGRERGSRAEARWPGRLGAWTRPSASRTDSAMPSSPCSKTPPPSSALRGRAAPPAARTARRPAPALTSPWRRGPAPGGGSEALAQRRFTDRGAPGSRRPGLRGAAEGPTKFALGSRGKRMGLPGSGRRDAAPLRRSSGSQPEGRPRSAASASPAPPTGRTEQAQPGPREFLWGWDSAGRTPRGSSRRWAGPCRRAGAHVTATALGIGRWTKSGPSTLSRSTWRWQGR